jgi:hypothetical protein
MAIGDTKVQSLRNKMRNYKKRLRAASHSHTAHEQEELANPLVGIWMGIWMGA